MEIKVSKGKHIPFVGVFSGIFLIGIILGMIFLPTWGKQVLATMFLGVAILTVRKVRQSPNCYKWEKTVFAITIAFVFLSFFAAISQDKGDAWAYGH